MTHDPPQPAGAERQPAHGTASGHPGGPASDGRGNVGWTIFSYLLAGMLFYGGLGWLIAHWTGLPLLFPMGMALGLVLSVGLVLYRFGRSS